jgi:Tfp pilus tip-associated adhesin PilY1
MQVRKGGAWRTIVSGQAYINGAWRTILYGQCRKSSLWRDVCNFTVSPTPTPTPTPAPTPTPTPTPAPTPTPTPTLTVTTNITESSATSSTATITGDPVTATPSGGASPYSYAWSIVSTDGHTFTITAPTFATTNVKVSSLADGATAVCSVHCVVHDSTGLSGTSPTVTYTFDRSSGPEGGGTP